MANSRQVQHRQERESAKGRELAEAKKEIKQLKRQVSRLHKTIRKMEEERGVEIELEEASPPTLAEIESDRKDPDGCSKCGSNTWVSFTTPTGKTISACKKCKTRRAL